MSDNLPQRNPYELYHNILRGFFDESIQYGFHTDDNGPNAGRGYVIAQVLEAMRALEMPPEPAAYIFATMVCMEETLVGGFAYTSDMPMEYDRMVREVVNGTT